MKRNFYILFTVIVSAITSFAALADNSFNSVKKKAENGDAMAQYDMGTRYNFAKGVSKDMTKAMYWYKKSAEQGFAPAQYNLGCCYENGWEIEKNGSEAFKWYSEATKSEFAPALYNLSVCYKDGVGTNKGF